MKNGGLYGKVRELEKLDIQIESTSAINKMYNYQFEEAEKEFRWLSGEYKDHPLPIFLLGLSLWWKIDAEENYIKIGDFKEKNKLDEKFIDLMDQSINLS